MRAQRTFWKRYAFYLGSFELDTSPNRSRAAMIMQGTDVFGIENYRCNAPPVNPFEGLESDKPEYDVFSQIMDSGGWRVDCGRPRTSK